MTELIRNLDEFLLMYVYENLHTPIVDRFMIFITNLGNSGIVWIVIAFLLLLFKKTRPIGIVLTLSLSLQFLLGERLLKPFFERPRPFLFYTDFEPFIRGPKSFSFPSGHTMSSFTATTVIFYYNKLAGIMSLLLAALIGFSRVYLFVHYPSDILGGMLLGFFTAMAVIAVFQRIHADSY
ncbi:phosphatase PAP2 family protein [Anaerocolumna cellulosilytica]|nr:phosphatase PAP2 family protein [Anaerocolumna cellulosilytica]MBB5196969.1 undecaprenyl-diphosphatase [Anaerocolumna cellulosilytica]